MNIRIMGILAFVASLIALAVMAFVGVASAHKPATPSPYADWMAKQYLTGVPGVTNGCQSCCGIADGHRLAFERLTEKSLDSWEYYNGPQQSFLGSGGKTVKTKPTDPFFIMAMFHKHWHTVDGVVEKDFPIYAKDFHVRTNCNGPPSDETNPTGDTVIWYSDTPPTVNCPKCGNIIIWCFVRPPAV